MKKRLALLTILITGITLTSCGTKSDSSDNSETTMSLEKSDDFLKENLDAESDDDFFQENLDNDYDDTAEYNGETYYKVDQKCLYDITMNPIGKLSIKVYEPAEGVTDKDVLIRIFTESNSISTLTDPDSYDHIGSRAAVENIYCTDFNEDGFDDIIILENYSFTSYDAEGNEIIADESYVKLFYGDEHGSLIEDASFENSVNLDLYEYDLDNILSAVRDNLN